MSKKGALTAEDLAELVDVYRRIQRLAGSLNYRAPAQHPLFSAAASVKAAWAEISGEAMAWSYPDAHVPVDGVPARTRMARPGPDQPMRPIGPLDDLS